MGIREKATVQLEEQTKAAVRVPVLGVASVNRVGTLGYIVASTFRDLGGELLLDQGVGAWGLRKDEIRRQEGRPTSLPVAFVLAVTSEHVHVFDVRFGPFGRVRLKNELGRFERTGLQLAVQQDKASTAYHMYSPGQGQDMMFEMMGGTAAGGEYPQELAALIRNGTPPSWTIGR